MFKKNNNWHYCLCQNSNLYKGPHCPYIFVTLKPWHSILITRQNHLLFHFFLSLCMERRKVYIQYKINKSPHPHVFLSSLLYLLSFFSPFLTLFCTFSFLFFCFLSLILSFFVCLFFLSLTTFVHMCKHISKDTHQYEWALWILICNLIIFLWFGIWESMV